MVTREALGRADPKSYEAERYSEEMTPGVIHSDPEILSKEQAVAAIEPAHEALSQLASFCLTIRL